ncbi:MAG: N-acyl homoserine lactonase family protein [Alphaproteobacteria bacterium]|nr:N-acyl homoserine lactonase family protein [Alphaproteobacteria bacterium]
MDEIWQVFAVKYAERNERVRKDSFIMDDDHASPHDMDYFVWVLKNEARTIVVDTGYDAGEAQRRDRPILRDPAEAVRSLGVDADTVDTVIITHLHYDHAGGLDRFPKANFHLQSAEMAFATGPCMCHPTMQMPYTADHVCEMVKKVYSGRVIFHDGDGSVAPGVTVHHVGGHSRGMQAVRVKTAAGWMCLASDAAHYYENFLARKPFPIVDSLEHMLEGWKTIQMLAETRDLVIPGHDPLVTERFPQWQHVPFVWRLDGGPSRPFED